MQSCYTGPAGALTLAFQAARPPEAHYTPNLYLSVSVLMVCPFLFLYLLYTLRTQVLLITFTVISSVPALLVCHSALDTDSVRSFYAQLCLWTARLWRPPSFQQHVVLPVSLDAVYTRPPPCFLCTMLYKSATAVASLILFMFGSVIMNTMKTHALSCASTLSWQIILN